MRFVPTILIAFASVLAGCVTETADIPALPATYDCPLFPDGTPMDCDADIVSEIAVAATPPTMDEGWFCTIDHDDEAPEQIYRVYSHQDGRAGWFWRQELRPGPTSFISMGLYAASDTQWFIFPYEPEGFVAFPEPYPGGEGEIEISIRRFVLDVYENNEWRPAPGARLIINEYEHGPYYLWQWDSPDGPMTIDIMVPSGESAGEAYIPKPKLIRGDGWIVSAAQEAATVDFGSQYLLWPRGLAGDCTSEPAGSDMTPAQGKGKGVSAWLA